ncbi:MAG TPA: GTP-binding protein, partial [Candidatus Aminicenantes bacterium]|nr:GTP-binding protein [Candidatus Aminicenantes bacterium]
MTIEEFLKAEGEKDLLRFSTAGSVDDGKSTLIGRLLCDSKNIYLDQLASVKRVSGQINHDLEIDYAFFTDGLKAEREQGITIDVAYRFFSTPKRKFIIADTPGHEQYTRNMATGASTANLALILIDARKGVLPQSKRHAFISSLLGIPHVVVAVNKMDLVDYAEPVFQEIVRDFTSFAARLQIPDLRFIPVSALIGDNLLVRSERTPWYRGQPLMEILETITVTGDRNLVDLRFPVQMVIRPDLDYRAYAGVVASGVMRPGDEVVALPSQKTSRIRSIETWEGPLQEAFPPLSVAVTLEDELDVGRGDMLVHRHNLPRTGRHIEAMVVWMGEQPLDPARRYLIKQTTRMTDTAVDRILYRVDVNTLKREPAGQLALNEIGRVVFAT